MIRLLLLTMATTALTPIGPLGCPPNDQPIDASPADRVTLTTTATADPQQASVGQTVMLYADADPRADGGTIAYAWLQTAGRGVIISTPGNATASFLAPSLGTAQALRFMVTTRDEAGAVGRAEVSVTVAADPNYEAGGSSVLDRPQADAGSDQLALPSDEIKLSAARSRGVSRLDYEWTQVSGPDVELLDAQSEEASFIAPGHSSAGGNTLLFQLKVRDQQGREDADRTQVSVMDPTTAEDLMRIDTNLGYFVIQLYPDDAPVTVENFLQYVDEGFYEGTIFHRVIPDFVIQGGGYTADLELKETHDPIVNEADNGLSNRRGWLAMARTNDPDSATSQFFINLLDNIEGGDGTSNLDPGGVSPEGYAVFAQVIQAMHVVDRIAALETETRGGLSDVPVRDVVIEGVSRLFPASDEGSGGQTSGTSTKEAGLPG